MLTWSFVKWNSIVTKKQKRILNEKVDVGEIKIKEGWKDEEPRERKLTEMQKNEDSGERIFPEIRKNVD